MNLLAALARVVSSSNRTSARTSRALNSAQKTQLKQLDKAVRAQPDRPIPHFNRARYLDLCGADFADILEAVRPGVRLTFDHRKSCVNAHYLLEINREDWDDYVRGRQMAEANYWLAYAVASFEVALQRSPDLADWNAMRPADWDALAALKGAAEFDPKNANWPQTPDELKVLAHALAIVGEQCTRFNKDEETCADFIAAQVYTRAIQLQFGGYKRRAADYLPCARNGRIPEYRQLAWWNFIIEVAPDDANLRRARARWLSLRDFNAAALTDISRAIELSPHDPALYETRAKIGDHNDWWNLAPESNSKTADYLRAIELRIAAGQISDAPAKLRARGDYNSRFVPGIDPIYVNPCARARAFYTLAIAATPDDATLYMARARAGRAYVDIYICNNESPDIAYLDYVRALALDSDLGKARAGIVDYLRNNTRRPTAHQQIEALMQAREQLVEAGVDAATATEIISEVERALAQ